MELARTSSNSPDDSDHDDHDLDLDALHHPDDAATIALGAGPGANGMATMVAQTAAGNGALGGQAQKRYRPAPAKTFQCRGYGECRMVFSRSEHLARHIRKHTGERPFSCHCGKQFSRLDNLRQHAQTVHADKQDQNEQMMRDLTSLHATMAAANKGGGRSGTSSGRRGTAAANTTSNATTNAGHQVGGNAPKQEDMGLGLGLSLRPGTSTGYEGDMWASTSPSATAGGNHSFRDSREASQSFLASQHHGSFRGFGADHRPFTSSAGYPASSHPPNGEGRPSTATAPAPAPLSSRPTTSSGPPDPSRTLPPLSAVVSASLAPSPPPGALGHPHHPFVHGPPNGSSSGYTGSGLPFPFRRPTTATRPGTAPAFFAKSSSASSYPPSGFGGLAAPREREREFLSSRDGLGSRHGGGQHDREAGGAGGGWEYEQGQHDSPFYFNAPSVADNQPGVTSTGSSSTPGSSACPSTSTSTGTASSHGVPTPTAATSPNSGVNPRKRGFGGPDGPAYDDDSVHAHREPPRSAHGVYGGAAGFGEREPPRSAHGGFHGRSSAREYEYGSESRPASRRISVMELCNETDAEPPRSSHGLRPQSSAGTFAFNVPSSSVGAPAAATFAFNPPATAPTATTGPGTPGVLSPSTSSSSAFSAAAAGGGRPASAYAAFGLSSRTPSSTSTRSFRRSPSSSTSPSGFLYASRPATGTTAVGAGRGGGGSRAWRGEQYRSTASPESRPTTSSGLVASAATLHIFDRGSPIAVDAYEREREREQREQQQQRFGGGRPYEYERKHVEYGSRRGYEQREPTDSPSSRLSPYPEQYDGDGDGGRGSRSPASSASAATPIFAFSAPAPAAPAPPVALPSASSAAGSASAPRAYEREGRFREEAASQRFCESPELEEGIGAAAAGRGVFERDAGYARRGYDEREYDEYGARRPGSSRGGSGYERERRLVGYEHRVGGGGYEQRASWHDGPRDYRGGGERGEYDERDGWDGGRDGWRRRRRSVSRDDGEEEFGADERERVSPPASASRSAAAVVRRDVSAERGGADGRVLRRYGPDSTAGKSSAATATAAVDDAHRERVFGYRGVLPGRDGAAAAGAGAARGRAEEDEGADGDAGSDGGDEKAARDEAYARADGDGDAAPAPATSTAAVSSSSATTAAGGNALAPPAFASSASATSRTPSSSSAASSTSSTAPATSASTAHALPGGSRVRAGPEFDADGAAGVSRGVPPATADAKQREREPGWEYRERERYGYERDVVVGGKYEYGGRGELRRGERGWDVSEDEDEDGDVEMSDVEVKLEVDELEMDV